MISDAKPTPAKLFLLTAAIAMLASLLLAAVPAAARSAEVETARLLGFGDVAGRTFTVDVEAGWCVGSPKPRIDHLDVREHGRSARYPKGYVVVTAFVVRERSPEVEEAEAEGRPATCKAVTVTFLRRIRLRRPAAGLAILDGSRQPRQRIPRLEHGLVDLDTGP